MGEPHSRVQAMYRNTSNPAAHRSTHRLCLEGLESRTLFSITASHAPVAPTKSPTVIIAQPTLAAHLRSADVSATASDTTSDVVNPANGHIYRLLPPTSWAAAEAEAVSLGGHLATIRSASEQQWVWSTFGSASDILWIGINDVATEGTFAWTSGEPVTYTDWGPNAPDNMWAGGENWGSMWRKASIGYDGQWNDLGPNSPEGTQHYAIAEMPAPTNVSLKPLGSLSERYESGGAGPGTISSGKGDPGGKSYGVYQLSSKLGVLTSFVNQYYSAALKPLRIGSKQFDAEWRLLALQQPDQFREAQFQFIKTTHYDKQVAQLISDLGFDIDTRSRALQNVVWSTAVQHGPLTAIVETAIAGIRAGRPISAISDAEIIPAIYAERGRKDAKGVPVYFRKSSKTVRKNVLIRFQYELADAMSEFQAEA